MYLIKNNEESVLAVFDTEKAAETANKHLKGVVTYTADNKTLEEYLFDEDELLSIKKADKRAERDSMFDTVQGRIDRYKEQTELGITTKDSLAVYQKLLQYKQYLRDFPEQTGEWWTFNILSFEEWLEEEA